MQKGKKFKVVERSQNYQEKLRGVVDPTVRN
jgi:hypothetical protein